MTKNNIKLLTDDQIKGLKERFTFTIKDEGILVVNNDYDRATLHSYDKPFFINSRIRKITFTVEGMEFYRLFRCKYPLKNYNLIDIQQAINKLYILYQPITEELILDILENGIKKLKQK